MQLYINAHIYTMAEQYDCCSAMLVDGDTIRQVYKTTPTQPIDAEIIDLQGAFVYPGFIDTHTHSFEGGLYSLGANLEHVANLDDVFDILRNTPPVSGMIFAFHFDERSIPEQRFPSLAELDAIHPSTPLILRRVDGHSCAINSAAAKAIDWEEPLSHDFNGYLFQRPNDVAANWFHLNLDDEGILRAYHKAAETAIKAGHTTVHTMIGNGRSNPEHYALIEAHRTKFPVEYILYPQISDVDAALQLGSARIGGCILADGSFGSHTAALTAPYTDKPSTCGTLYHDNAYWMDLVKRAHDANLQVAVHCIGDRAIDQILRCYETVQKENPKDLRHELIHNELVDDAMLNRMKDSNITAVMQPMFDRLWGGPGGLYETVLGKERTRITNRFSSLVKAGITVSGGSDWYVTDLDALAGIEAAMHHHNPNEALPAHEAIAMYTSAAAVVSHDEHRLGKLLAGYQADFVVLDKAISHHSPTSVKNIRAVYKAGQKREVV